MDNDKNNGNTYYAIEIVGKNQIETTLNQNQELIVDEIITAHG